jgi:hypothetical protein
MPLVQFGGIEDAIVKSGDDIGLLDTRKRPTFGQRWKVLNEGHRIALAHLTRKHVQLLIGRHWKAQSDAQLWADRGNRRGRGQ